MSFVLAYFTVIGLSPVWVRKCELDYLLVAYFTMICFSPVCMGRCAIRSLFPENCSLHTLQWHGLSFVDPKMCFKIYSKWKLLVAYFTVKWFISYVDANVSIRLKKLLVAHVARIRFFTHWIRRCLLRHPWFKNCLPHNSRWYGFVLYGC